jgi:hypothetical protein
VADCLCDLNTFNDQSGVNNSFSCAAVPEGGWAPQADSRLFALVGYWRPGPEHFEFYPCSAGNCLREQLPPDNATAQVGFSCRHGHTGHLCSVCENGWAYQGVFCKTCDLSHRFANWGAAKTGAIIFFSTFLLLLFIFCVFFLPLCPRVEEMLARMTSPAAARLEVMLGNMVETAARLSRTARPRSAALRPSLSAAAPEGGAAGEQAPDKGRVRTPRAGHLGARTRAIVRRTSYSTTFTTPATNGRESSTAHVRVRVQRPTRVAVLMELVSKPLRIIISFWQCVGTRVACGLHVPPLTFHRVCACRVVSSFSSNLYVPWPSIYCPFPLLSLLLCHALAGGGAA